jgi:hypothetical protein
MAGDEARGVGGAAAARAGSMLEVVPHWPFPLGFATVTVCCLQPNEGVEMKPLSMASLLASLTIAAALRH